MKPSCPNQRRARRRTTSMPTLLAGLGLALFASTTLAQVHRSVGPDGRVTYSDAPASAARAEHSAAATAALPFALRQAMQRYPVTLYSAAQCAPCDSGRQLLVRRGIPFTEKTVETATDVAALERLAGARELPVLTVGTQQIKGFSDIDWNQYLDAAGYARTSQLPSGWQQPAATPLAPAQLARPANAPSAPPVEDTTSEAEPAVTPTPTSTNPAGIRF